MSEPTIDKERFIRLSKDENVIVSVCNIFDALKDPTRFAILTALVEGQKSVSELVECVGVTQSAVSHQLRLLKDRKLVRSDRAGRSILYSLDDDHVQLLISVALEHAAEDFEGKV